MSNFNQTQLSTLPTAPQAQARMDARHGRVCAPARRGAAWMGASRTPAALVAAMLFLAGCSSGALGPDHDVAWFKTHTPERKEVLKTCASDPARYMTESNCINADRADTEVTMTAQDNLPRLPANLPPPEAEPASTAH